MPATIERTRASILGSDAALRSRGHSAAVADEARTVAARDKSSSAPPGRTLVNANTQTA
jgi:hypothetical protein